MALRPSAERVFRATRGAAFAAGTLILLSIIVGLGRLDSPFLYYQF